MTSISQGVSHSEGDKDHHQPFTYEIGYGCLQPSVSDAVGESGFHWSRFSPGLPQSRELCRVLQEGDVFPVQSKVHGVSNHGLRVFGAECLPLKIFRGFSVRQASYKDAGNLDPGLTRGSVFYVWLPTRSISLHATPPRTALS